MCDVVDKKHKSTKVTRSTQAQLFHEFLLYIRFSNIQNKSVHVQFRPQSFDTRYPV